MTSERDEGTSPPSRMLKPSSFSMPAMSLSCWARKAAAGSSSDPEPLPLPAGGALSMSKSSILGGKKKTSSEGRERVEREQVSLVHRYVQWGTEVGAGERCEKAEAEIDKSDQSGWATDD